MELSDAEAGLQYLTLARNLRKAAPTRKEWYDEESGQINPGAVSISLDLDPSLHAGCWHTARVHHRSRTLACPESSREREGSWLHQLWSAEQHPPPSKS